MTNALDVLVLESEPATADAAIAALQASGHTVHRCHDEGARSFPCLGVDQQCPLESASIDVALTIRARPRSVPGLLEDGVTCALKHRIPVVVGGHTALHPFAEHAAAVVESKDDLVATVEAAAHGSLRQHEVLAGAIAKETLANHEVASGPITATATRRKGVVRVVVDLGGAGDQTLRDVVATRVHMALRTFDRHARAIDIAVG